MRVLSVTHQADAPAGVFGDVALAAGHELVDWRPDRGEPVPDLAGFDAIMVLGGAAHPHQEELYPWLRGEKAVIGSMLERGIPLLAVCLGAELVAEVAGRPAVTLHAAEIGWFPVQLTREGGEDPVFEALPPSFPAFQWHSLAIELPSGAVPLAQGSVGLGAFRLDNAWAMQFHAEVTEAIVYDWIDDFDADPDVIVAGCEPDLVRGETRCRIEASVALGATICGGFLEQVTATRA